MADNSCISRRNFLRAGAIGLAAVGAGGYILRANEQPTPGSGREDAPMPEPFNATERNIQGPFFRDSAPFRAKITPPLSSGVVLLIQGRVWSFVTKKPLANAVLDIWQANAEGRYDNDNPLSPPKPHTFLNRARLLTDENGDYEFETIHPGHYPLDQTRMRPAHIHYRVMHPQHKTLITQLYFKGDPHIEGDPYVRPSLIIDLKKQNVGEASYEHGIFDIVLAPPKPPIMTKPKA